MPVFECPKGCGWHYESPPNITVKDVSHACPKVSGKQVVGSPKKEDA